MAKRMGNSTLNCSCDKKKSKSYKSTKAFYGEKCGCFINVSGIKKKIITIDTALLTT